MNDVASLFLFHFTAKANGITTKDAEDHLGAEARRDLKAGGTTEVVPFPEPLPGTPFRKRLPERAPQNALPELLPGASLRNPSTESSS